MTGVGKYLWAEQDSTVWDIQDQEGNFWKRNVKEWIPINSNPILVFDTEGDTTYATAEAKEEVQATEESSSSGEETQDEEGLREKEED